MKARMEKHFQSTVINILTVVFANNQSTLNEIIIVSVVIESHCYWVAEHPCSTASNT